MLTAGASTETANNNICADESDVINFFIFSQPMERQLASGCVGTQFAGLYRHF